MHPLFAQRAPNANASYQQLRGLLPGSEAVNVKDFVLKRDAAEFTFHSGSFAFYGAVNGKVTGAVFKGQGHLHITPPTAEERHNLSLVTQTEEFDEDFDQVVLRFTDATADELHKASTGPGQPDNAYAKAAEELRSFLRHHAEGSYDEERPLVLLWKALRKPRPASARRRPELRSRRLFLCGNPWQQEVLTFTSSSTRKALTKWPRKRSHCSSGTR